MSAPGVREASIRRVSSHVVVWLGVFVFWLFVTRADHPTVAVAISATAMLVVAFALAVYANGLVLWPRFATPRLWLQYALSLLTTVVVITAVVVIAIQVVYDALWGPDPNRFGFWTNMAYDGTLILIHVAVAVGVTKLAWVLRFRTRRFGKN